jgi:hypothetical protein
MKRSTLPFPARGEGRDEDVAGVVVGEDVSEHARAAVDERVVGHDRFDGPAALLAEPGDRAPQRRGGGSGAVGAVQLDVGEPGVVIDDAVRIAGPGPVVAVSGAIAMRPVTWLGKAREVLGVHVQQRARLRPFIAPVALAWR